MVVIKKQSNIIPIEFPDFTLEFKFSDENIKRVDEINKKFKEKAESIQNVDDDKALEELFESVKMAWTEMFDEETFKKVYEFSDETTTTALIYLMQVSDGILFEYQERMDAVSKERSKALKKYLG